jgi:hypothetical protein
MSVEVKVEIPSQAGDDSALVLEPHGKSGDLFVRVRAKSGRLPREGVYVSAADLEAAVAALDATPRTAVEPAPAAPARKAAADPAK